MPDGAFSLGALSWGQTTLSGGYGEAKPKRARPRCVDGWAAVRLGVSIMKKFGGSAYLIQVLAALATLVALMVAGCTGNRADNSPSPSYQAGYNDGKGGVAASFVRSGVGIHAQPPPSPPPVPSIADQQVPSAPPDWVDPDDEGGPTTRWGGFGVFCENQWIICQ